MPDDLSPVAAGSPRIRKGRGLFIEAARSNLLRFSADFSDDVWYRNRLQVTDAGIAAPDGVGGFQRLTTVAGGPTISNAIQPVMRSAGQRHCFSVYLRADTAPRVIIGQQYDSAAFSDSIFDFAAGSFVVTGSGAPTLRAEALEDGVWRLSCALTAASSGSYECYFGPITAGGSTAFNIANGMSVDAWGAQCELASLPGTPIPTEAAQVTRAAEVARFPTGPDWFNPSAGTLRVELGMPAPDYIGFPAAGALSDDSFDNQIYLAINGTGDAWTAQTRTQGTSGGLEHIPTEPAESRCVAVAYDGHGIQLAADGSLGQGSALPPAGLPAIDQLQLGTITRGNHFNGFLRGLTYWPWRMAAADLRELTR